MICDWCGKNNSKSSDSKEVFHILAGYAFTPVICDNCYSELKKTKSFTWKQKNSRTIKPMIYDPSILEHDKV